MNLANSETIGIFIPYIAGKELLLKTLASVLSQTDTDWRLTIVDNSSESEAVLLLPPDLQDQRISIHRVIEKLSMVENWNRCIALATTRLFVICHSDDEWEDSYLSTIRQLATKYPDASAYTCGGFAIDLDSKPKFSLAEWYKSWISRSLSPDGLLRGELGAKELAKGNFIFCSVFCFVKKYDKPHWFDNQYQFVPDYEMTFRLIFNNESIAYSSAKLCKYRRHNSQATINLEKNFSRFEEEIKFYQSLTEKSRERNWNSVARISQRCIGLRINILVYALRNLLKRKPRIFLHYLALAASTY
jgi:glycosyltransferase involved in cell wall biosynthesis